MLGRVIGRPARLADQATKRGTVDDGATALGTHLEQFVFHTRPDTAQVDGGHGIEGLCRFIGQIAHRAEDTGIIKRHVQSTEGGDRALDHGGGLHLVRHVAGDANRPVPSRSQFLGRGAQRGLVDVHEHDGSARRRDGTRAACRIRSASPSAAANACAVASPMPELAPVTRATWPVKSYTGFMGSFLLFCIFG